MGRETLLATTLLLMAGPAAAQGAEEASDVRIEVGATAFAGAADLLWDDVYGTTGVQADILVRWRRFGVALEREWAQLHARAGAGLVCPGIPEASCPDPRTGFFDGPTRGDWALRLEAALPGLASLTGFVGAGLGSGRTPGDLRYESRLGLVGARLPVGWGAAVRTEVRLRRDEVVEASSSDASWGTELRLGLRWAPFRLVPGF